MRRNARLLLALLVAFSCRPATEKHATHFVEIETDVLAGLDGKDLQLTPEELQGRMLWNLWSGDNAGFWSSLAQRGFGTADLLKTIDSRNRSTRFSKMGIINQPGFQSAAKADAFGLFLDVPHPGDPAGSIDENIDAATYGRSSGVVGLRIFPNPDFAGAARDAWMRHIAADGVNHDYYENPRYYNDAKLVRPYRVGMACAFCHVGPDPIRPPSDPENPKWDNLNDFIGSQYLRADAVFGNGMGADSFVWQVLHSYKPGTVDTSLIATDYLNNPGTMNALFNIPQRLTRAEAERVGGGALALRGVTDPIRTPRVLKEGADSVGFTAALSRVFVNIGEDWPASFQNINPLIGGKPQSPFDVARAQRESPEWNWSETHTPALAAYFIKVARPLLLKDAPGGAKYLTADAHLLDRGKIVFAENCAGCHSSKQPPAGVVPYSAEGKAWFRAQVQSDPEFFTDNFLGDERRHPVDVVGTNAVRAAARNALRGHIWDNFSSETYKTLPAIKPIELFDPFTAETFDFQLPGGGPGYYRPPSLVSLWATAPFFHNNALGEFNGDPSVEGRMRAFDDAMAKLLWPETRLGRASILRTTGNSYIQIPVSYLPAWLPRRALAGPDGNVRIGPIPKGTPVDLIANLDLDRSPIELAKLALAVTRALHDIDAQHLGDEAATTRLVQLVPQLMKLNACPDFIEDKGHPFGTKLPDSDKKALIALLKTF